MNGYSQVRIGGTGARASRRLLLEIEGREYLAL